MLLCTSENEVWDTTKRPFNSFSSKSHGRVHHVAKKTSLWRSRSQLMHIDLRLCPYLTQISISSKNEDRAMQRPLQHPHRRASSHAEQLHGNQLTALISSKVSPRHSNWTGWHWSALLHLINASLMLQYIHPALPEWSQPCTDLFLLPLFTVGSLSLKNGCFPSLKGA